MGTQNNTLPTWALDQGIQCGVSAMDQRQPIAARPTPRRQMCGCAGIAAWGWLCPSGSRGASTNRMHANPC